MTPGLLGFRGVGDKMRLQDSGDEGLRGFRGLGLRASGFPAQV